MNRQHAVEMPTLGAATWNGLRGIRVLLVAGPTGAGKTTLCRSRAFQERLCSTPHAQASVLKLDRYFLPMNQRPRWNGVDPALDHPESLRWDWMAEDLPRLLSGQPVDVPEYWDSLGQPNGVSHRRSGTVLCLGDADVLIVESIHTLNARLVRHFAKHPWASLFLDAPPGVRLVRRLCREVGRGDQTTRGVLSTWDVVRYCERRYVSPLATVALEVVPTYQRGELEARRLAVVEYLHDASMRDAAPRTRRRRDALLRWLERCA